MHRLFPKGTNASVKFSKADPTLLLAKDGYFKTGRFDRNAREKKACEVNVSGKLNGLPPM